MSYGADFASADPANAPLDAPIYLGADPVLLGAGILLLLAALLLGWFLGTRTGPKTGDASHAIWKAIDEAAKEAMKADDNGLRGKAEHLLTVIDNRLGKTLALAGGKDGLAGCVAALRNATQGKRPEKKADEHKAGHDDKTKPHEDKHDDKHDDHGSAKHGPTSSVGAAAANIVINVAPSAPPAKPEKPEHKPHDPHPPKELTVREQTDLLRLAVAAFNEHWRHEKSRTKALQDALAELSNGGGRAEGHGLSRG